MIVTKQKHDEGCASEVWESVACQTKECPASYEVQSHRHAIRKFDAKRCNCNVNEIKQLKAEVQRLRVLVEGVIQKLYKHDHNSLADYAAGELGLKL